MIIIKKGTYLFQFLAREITNDLYECIYTDCQGVNGNKHNIGEEAFTRGQITLEKGSVIGERTLLKGNIKIGRNTFISPRATVQGNVSIGSECYIEAGAVVSKDIPSKSYAYGNHCNTKKMMQKFSPKNFGTIREPSKKPPKDISNFFPITCKIDKNTVFGKQVYIEGGAKIEFGKNCKIGNRCMFLGTQHPHNRKEDMIETEQHWHDIKIGNNVEIEDNCIILGGVTIGNKAIIKAGSIVTKKINAGSISSGCPAKPNHGKPLEAAIKFPHIANVWAVTGHMYPTVAYYKQFRNIFIGNKVLINDELMIIGKQNIKIGKKSLIGPRVTLITENPLTKGGIEIGEHCFIGGGAVILPNVKIRNGAIIGAGSVVNKDVEENEIWVGNIAKKIKKRSY